MVSYGKVLLLAALLVLCISQGLGYQRCGGSKGLCVPKNRNCRIISPTGCAVHFKCCRLNRTDD